MPDITTYYNPIATETARQLALCGFRDATSGMRSDFSTAGMTELECAKYLVLKSPLMSIDEKEHVYEKLTRPHLKAYKNGREQILRDLLTNLVRMYGKDEPLRMANEIMTVKLQRSRQESQIQPHGIHKFTYKLYKAEKHIDTAEAREMTLAIIDRRESNRLS